MNAKKKCNDLFIEFLSENSDLAKENLTKIISDKKFDSSDAFLNCLY